MSYRGIALLLSAVVGLLFWVGVIYAVAQIVPSCDTVMCSTPGNTPNR